jgi:hypothetical protein
MLRNNGFLFANVQVAIDFTEQSVAHNWEYTVGGSSGLTIQALRVGPARNWDEELETLISSTPPDVRVASQFG